MTEEIKTNAVYETDGKHHCNCDRCKEQEEGKCPACNKAKRTAQYVCDDCFSRYGKEGGTPDVEAWAARQAKGAKTINKGDPKEAIRYLDSEISGIKAAYDNRTPDDDISELNAAVCRLIEIKGRIIAEFGTGV